MKLLSISLAVLTLMGGYAHAATVAEVRAISIAGSDARKTYIVQLAGEPAASYMGTVPGYAATRPSAGARFDARAANVKAYHAYLDSQQQSVVALIGRAPVLARYKTAYNGFAAKLTDAEVATLRASSLVIDVVPDEERKLETISTSTFLGLSTPGGVWSQTVGGLAVKGEDVVIGIVDGGVWPEGPSYADRVSGGVPVFSGGTLAYGPAPAGFSGTCVAGEGFSPATHCNNKLIGAQYFNAGFIASGRTKHWTEFFSPRDSVAGVNGHGGHGSHTSSTAGGNSGAPAIATGIALGPASGMAPRARISVYKVCYTYVDATATDGSGSTNSCFTSDSVSAIDKAVADGVQVINYSISGSQTSVNDPVEQAFLRAATAGVFVAASAGNSGPGQAVAHVSPWLTTVAASTHDRGPTGDVTLGNAAKYSGASFNTSPLPQTTLIRAEDAGLPGADPTQLKLCYLSPTVLDPAKITGKIVICTRGTNARVDKSAAVKAGGGVGMVMVDNGAGLVADFHSVPSVHLTAADGAAVQAYAISAGGSGTSAIGTYYNVPKPAPIMASFSSRGPNAGDSNMLKPDLTAPGVDIIATVTPALTQAQRDAVANGTLVPPPEWASYQGTSMSSPHVAGVAALLRQAKPTWSPSAIKSALMTTAYTTLNDGVAGDSNGLLPFAQGAGHINPTAALDPGLVYDNSPIDFTRYQCLVNKAAVVPASDCTTYGTLDQTYNYNLPSVTVGSMLGAVTVTRKVTNVGSSSASYNGSVSIAGFTPLLTPASLTLAPGETKTFTLKLTPTTAAVNVWNYGSMTWTDGVHNVKSPVTAQVGNPISAPASITGNTNSGSKVLTVATGFAGKLTANKGGLKDVTLGASNTLSPAGLSSASLKAACTAGSDTASVKVYPVSILANTVVARFALRQVDVSGATDDNDMGLLAPDGTWVYSGNDGSNESVQVLSPAAGSYKVCVTAWGGTPSMSHRLSSWVVTTSDTAVPSNLNVLLPGQVFTNSTAAVGLSWSGLTTGSRYMGAVQFKDAGGVVRATTAVRIEPNGGLPLTADQPRVTSSVKLRQ
jgi:subtilisin family serine protease